MTTTAVESKYSQDISPYSSLDILKNEMRGHREERIQLADVITDFALVDESHAEDLGNSMQSDRGQLTPILVRARLAKEKDGRDKVEYDVIDGFHRTEGRRTKGEKDIRATVLYGCDDEEMFDLRILAASSVQSVQYPRLAEWMTRSYQASKWADSGLKVHQVFGIAQNDSNTPRGVKLSKDDIQELKDWASGKVKNWGKTLATTYQILLVVSSADPELVRQVRSGTSGGNKDRQGKITPQRLAAVVNKFPGDEYYSTQRAVLRWSVENRLSAAEVNWLVDSLGSRAKRNMSQSSVRRLIERVYREDDIQHQQEVEAAKAKAAEESANNSNAQTSGDIDSPLEDLAGLALGLDLDTDDFDPDDEVDPLPDADLPRMAEIVGATKPQDGSKDTRIKVGEIVDVGRNSGDRQDRTLSGTYETSDDLRKRIVELEEMLEVAKKNQGPTNEWWKTATYLSSDERNITDRLLTQLQDFETIQNELGIPSGRIVTILRSAFAKRALTRER